MSTRILSRLATASCIALVLSLAASVSAQRPKSGGPKAEAGPQVKEINKQVRTVWTDYEITPSKPASDGEWCRRLYLDVLGRIPSVDELDEYVKSRDKNKRRDLVRSLLYDAAYTEEYARNWTTIWTNILIGRSGGTEQNSMISRDGMQKYLRDSFARNKPYDRMVHELVSATGSTTPGQDDFNGATNFLVMKVNEEKATLATAATAKTFLGLQVQCTQCHDHPFNEWKQAKFWQMNAFFRQARAQRVGNRNAGMGGTLVDVDFKGEDDQGVDEASIYYELRNAELEVAFPTFVDGKEATSRDGRVTKVNRRSQLADMMLKSEYLEKTIVNRYWAHFLGYGFTKPIDDIGPHNPSSHPELLEYLSAQVRESSFNLKELITWVVLSDSYSLSSKMNATNKIDDPLLGEMPKFSHFYLRQMRAEELYESLVAATRASQSSGNYEAQERLKAQWLGQFVQAFGNDEGEETTTFNGTIPQALMMFNGDLIKKATNKEKGSLLWQVANSKLEDRERINFLFRAALARNSSENEYEAARQLLIYNKGDGMAAVQDIWWAVLNSNEFIINH
jgi:hypothetical protein